LYQGIALAIRYCALSECPFRGRTLLFGRSGLKAVAGSQRKVSRSTQQAAFLRRKLPPELLRVDELVALFRRQVAHTPYRPIDGLTAVGRQLFELLKQPERPLLLVGIQVLPGLHAVKHPLLLLPRQAGKMLQPLLQAGLLLRRKFSELRIVFERAALLARRQILIAAEPVSGMAGLILRRTGLIGMDGAGMTFFGMTFFLKVVPLPVRALRLGMALRRRGRMPILGEQRRQQQKRHQTARNFSPAHFRSLLHFHLTENSQQPNFFLRASGSRIRGCVILDL